jgi:hypothetical protein
MEEMDNSNRKGGRSAEDELTRSIKPDGNIRTWTGGSVEYQRCMAGCTELAEANCLTGPACFSKCIHCKCNCTPEEFENFKKPCEHNCFCEEDSHYGPPNIHLYGKVKIENWVGLYANYKGESKALDVYNSACPPKERWVDYLFVAIENSGTYLERECNSCSRVWVEAPWGRYEHRGRYGHKSRNETPEHDSGDAQGPVGDGEDGENSDSSTADTWVEGHHKVRHNGASTSFKTRAEIF